MRDFQPGEVCALHQKPVYLCYNRKRALDVGTHISPNQMTGKIDLLF